MPSTLVNYYYRRIHQFYKNLGKVLSEIKKPAQSGFMRVQDLGLTRFPRTRLLRPPLQALLPHCFVQRFFFGDDTAQPGRIVDLATCNRADFVECPA